MKLVLLDLSYADPQSLAPWTRDYQCVCLSVRPLEGIDPGSWALPPAELSSFEALGEQHLALFRPLFAAGAANEGPRLPKAVLSHPAATDHAIFVGSRFHFPLLRDLERMFEEHPIDRAELVTDEADGGRCFHAFQSFARAKHLPSKVQLLHAPRRRMMQRIAGAMDAVAEQMHVTGPALVNKLRSMVKRILPADGSTASPAQPRSNSQGFTRPTQRIHAAMLVYTSESWRYLLPVREAMIAAGHEVVLMSPRLETDRRLEKSGLPFVSIRSHLPRAHFYRKVDEYYHSLPMSAADQLSARLITPDGAFRQMVRRLGLKTCQVYSDLAERLPELYRKHQINAVLGTDSASVAGRCLFRTAERMGITSVFLQHGALVVAPGLAEYFTHSHRLLWGTSAGDNLLAAKVADLDNIEFIGCPFLEQRLAVSEDERRQSAAPDAPVLVAFSVPGGFVDDSGFVRAAHEMLAAARQMPHIPFVIKPHPGDHTRVWDQLVGGAALPNVSIQRERDIYDLMKTCRLLLTMFSTAGAEAIYMAKPVVSINLERVEMGLDFLSAGAAYVIEDEGTLGPLLASILCVPPDHDPLVEKRQAFAQSFLHREERPAAERIVDYLEQLVLGPAELRSAPSSDLAATAARHSPDHT